MIALDTNILVRLLLNDDVVQCKQTRELFAVIIWQHRPRLILYSSAPAP